MALGRKQKTKETEGAAPASTASVMRLFLPGAAAGLLIFVAQGTTIEDDVSIWSIAAILASRLIADTVIGIVAVCAMYIAFYGARWFMALVWAWIKLNLIRLRAKS